jgi:hypothetical protein
LLRYFIPKSIAESVSKNGIKLRITTYEARTRFRFTSLRFTTNNNRNRMAAVIAFTSRILFLLSGYKANLMIYHLFENEVRIALRILSEVWSGHSLLANNYVIWLTSSAAGLYTLT